MGNRPHYPNKSALVKVGLSLVIGFLIAFFCLLSFFIRLPASGLTAGIAAIFLWCSFAVFSYVVLFHLAVSRLALRGFSRRFIWNCFLLMMATGLYLYFAIPLHTPKIPDTSQLHGVFGGLITRTAPAIYPAACAAAFGIVMILLFALFARPAGPVQSRTVSWKEIIFYALPMILVWAAFLFFFWPGLMTSDSIDQWQQILRGRYNDAHPAFHTATLWLITRLALSPGTIAGAQILLLTLVSACAFYQVRRYGAPRSLVRFAVFLYTVSIPNIFLSITLWKDVLFAVSVIFLFILWFEIVMSSGAWLRHWSHVLLLILALLYVSLFRHNGLAAVLFALVLLLAFGKPTRIKVVIASGLFLFVFLLINGPVYRFAKISIPGSYFEVITEIFHIGGHLNSGTVFSPDELKILNAIRPVQDHWDYNCYSSGSILYTEKFNNNAAVRYAAEIRSIFLDSLIRNPVVNLRHILCSSSLVWAINNNRYGLNTVPLYWKAGRIVSIETNPNGIENHFAFPELSQFIGAKILSIPTHRVLNILIWSPALYFYILIFGVVLFSLEHSKAYYLLLLGPVVGIALSIALFNGSQDFRYMYPIYTIALLYWPFFYNRHRSP